MLDAGCASGRYLDVLKDSGAEVIGIDLGDAIDVAQEDRASFPHVHFVQAGNFQLPFRDDWFDCIHRTGVLRQSPGTRAALQALTAKLAPGGRFSIFVHPDCDWVYRGIADFYRKLTARLPKRLLYNLRDRNPPLPRSLAWRDPPWPVPAGPAAGTEGARLKRGRLLKDMGAVGLSLYVTRALYLLRGLVTARFLGPSDYGVWGTLGILLNYSNAAPLGSAEAVAREVPFHTERGEKDRARTVVEQSFSFNLYVSLVASLAIIAYAHLRRATLDPIFFIGLHIAGAGITLQQLYFYYGIVLRAEKRFFFQSKVNVLFALVNVPLTIALVAIWRLHGLYAAYILVYVWIVGYLLWNVPIRLRARLDVALIGDLIQIGFPVYLLGLVYTLFMSVDRMIIAKFLTPADMGYYTIAYTIIGTLGEVPMVIAQVMSPNLIGRYSKSVTPAEMLPYVEMPTVAIATFFPALQVVVLIGIEWVLRYILPRFLPGFVAIEILLFGALFIALTRGPSSFLLAVRKQSVAVGIYVICVLAAFGLNLWFVKIGWGLVGVAVATSMTYGLLFALYVTYIFTFFFGRRARAYARLYVRLLLPFVLSALLYVALRMGIPLAGHAPFADAARALGRMAIYLALATPFLIAFLRRHGLWEPFLQRARWETLRDRLPFPRRRR